MVKPVPFLLLASLLLGGCITAAEFEDPTPSPTATGTPDEPLLIEISSAEVQRNDAPPSITISASPSNPDRGQVFTLAISSQDDLAVKALSWESADVFTKQPETNSFDCGLQKICSVNWDFSSGQDGLKTITVYSTDSTGHYSGRTPVEIDVRPFDARPASTVTPIAGCGNDVCDSGEAFETCAQDCPAAGFRCANGVCEGGESYQSCPQDCSVSSIVGSTCGDGACERGEDKANCPADCTSIKPNCGNNVCDAWENSTSCLADCESAGATEDACTYNSACGYKQICQGGKCVSVDCTNDAQCSYGKECKYNRCVRCPRGPYGPAC